MNVSNAAADFMSARYESLKASSDVEIAKLKARVAYLEATETNQIVRLKRRIAELEGALCELHATVRGECPSLLNEDSGGSGELAVRIEAVLATGGDTTRGAR